MLGPWHLVALLLLLACFAPALARADEATAGRGDHSASSVEAPSGEREDPRGADTPPRDPSGVPPPSDDPTGDPASADPTGDSESSDPAPRAGSSDGSAGPTDAALADAAAPDAGDRAAGPFSVAFTGGLMVPRAELAEVRDMGLTAGLRFALTSNSGLGAQLGAEYAPLPPAGDDAQGAPPLRESHIGTVTLAPRFRLGRGAVRTWVAAGGGVMLDYEERGEQGAEAERTVDYEPVATAAAGLELHAFDSGGFVFMGRYGRSLNEVRYESISATAGLVLDF